MNSFELEQDMRNRRGELEEEVRADGGRSRVRQWLLLVLTMFSRT
ncbi:hypothetical protein MJA45_15575 [Paenibacillus aurantius]|uniref:Uncharacterized protein n=1 Tax=Paenibacillus aurantius TaxID=2918900 RepID=A0AA96L8P6_9BACL|nr:hypothetical protein [Paenibacillus aurantius]WJH33989.1 hypothetical protein N6H14_29120 [Paenibacillus sp. CC-CFT747]WNQ09067.1 hypothetical protein MJA45_15575 [Paenibacillus aurantius]